MSRRTPLTDAFRAHGRVEDCPIIDMHTHPGPYAGIYFPAPDAKGLLATMARANVQACAIAPHPALADPEAGNALMREMVAGYPGRFLGYLFVNPYYPELLEAQLPWLVEPHMLGFKLHPSSSRVPLSAPEHRRVFEIADAEELLVLSHTWNDTPCNVAECRRIAERYPRVHFLLGHSCYDDWLGAIALAQEFPRVYLELTAAAHITGVIELAVHAGVGHKLLFGTDLPWFDPFTTLGCVLYADIDDADRHAILHGNAERLLAARGISVSVPH